MLLVMGTACMGAFAHKTYSSSCLFHCYAGEGHVGIHFVHEYVFIYHEKGLRLGTVFLERIEEKKRGGRHSDQTIVMDCA